MSRRDLIQSAEKLVARGRLQAAAKEYRKVLDGEPQDITTLNRLGDLYARLNQVDDAVAMFRRIAEHYQADGFFVKAIAICKKILRLDPTQFDVYEALAELYHRQGLTGEARSQFQVVADYYRKHGELAGAIRIQHRLVDLAPDLPGERLTLAEIYQQAGRQEEALRQYRRIADWMLERGRAEEAGRVYERALEAGGAQDLGFVTDAVLGLKERGHAPVAQRVLQAAVALHPEAHRVGRLAGLGPELPPARPADGTPRPAAISGPARGAAAPDPPAPPPAAGAQRGAVASPPPVSRKSREWEELLAELTGGASVRPRRSTPVAAPPPAPAPAAPPAEAGFELELDLEGLEPGLAFDDPPAPREQPSGPTWIDAEELERSAAEVQPPAARNEEDLIAEAEVFIKYGLERKAVERLQEVLEGSPHRLDVRLRLIRVLLGQGDPEEALGEARRLARLASELNLPEPWEEARRELAKSGFRVEGERIGLPGRPAAARPGGRSSLAPPPVEPSAASGAGGGATLDLDWLEPAAAGAAPDAAPGRVFEEEEEFFDLAAELEKELEGEAELPLDGAAPLGREPSLKEIVDGFRKGVEESLSPRDYDTHYNLGIAYREMGLLDEAIGEFQLAAKDPRYLVDCCSMLGLCFLDKGFPELTVKWYRRGLESPAIRESETLGLLYELGNVYTTVGDTEAAFNTFVEIYGINSNYRDVVAKLEELGHGR